MKYSNKKLFLAGALMMGILFGFSSSEAISRKAQSLETLSAEAYIWGYPAVLLKHTREAMIEKESDSGLNHFYPLTERHEKFLKALHSLNSENQYSWAWIDLSSEPLVFSQPAVSDRYFSIQFVDAFTNVFQVISNDVLDGKSATYALTSPTWKGQLPAGVVRIKATTAEVFALSQTSAKKQDPRVQFVTLTNWNRGQRTPKPQALPAFSNAVVQKNLAPLGTQFLTELFEITQKNAPPTGADLKRLEELNRSLTVKLNAEERAAVERGLFAGARKIEDRIAEGSGPKVNGWSYELKAEPFREDYLLRAAVAQSTLFSTPSNEFVHLRASADNEGRQLYGDYAYTMHFEKGELPPTPSSWTLRVFEASNQEKAHLNDQKVSLKYNEDGTVDIHLQSDPPETKSMLANWLPISKETGFSVVLTIYNPNNSVLNRKFVAPALTREESDGLKKPKIVRTMMAKALISK